MQLRLILSRHGNTFAPGDPVVWTGSSNDLSLVDSGKQQAGNLATALGDNAIRLDAIYCGPLKRTRDYAGIVIEQLKLKLEAVVDTRLNEIDYGEWTGLTNEEVIGRFGETEVKAWDKQSKWPVNAGWTGSEQQVMADVQSIAADLIARHKADDTVLLVSSNGRLRYFLSLVQGELERRISTGGFKVKTGNVCELNWRDQSWSMRYWDAKPVEALGQAQLPV